MNSIEQIIELAEKCGAVPQPTVQKTPLHRDGFFHLSCWFSTGHEASNFCAAMQQQFSQFRVTQDQEYVMVWL
jgi:hypothetical protein